MQDFLSPQQQAKFSEMEDQARKSPERLAGEVLGRYIEEKARFLAAVEPGIAAAERGEFIEEEHMNARIESMFKT